MNEQAKHYADKLAFEIDSSDLQSAVNNGDRVTIIDCRSPAAYAAEHIPGAINLPHRTMDARATAAVDPESLVVAYCDGIGCNGSTKGALNMTNLGFRVKELMGGLDWWKRDGYPTHGTVATIAGGPACGCG